MGRLPCRDGAGVEKGPWTPEEDKLLVDYIGAHGHGSWHRLPRLAGLNRTGKSCRLRWTNHLRPDIKRVPFTNDEEKLLFSLRSTLGNKWSKIATRMPGRTGNEIKNYWFTHLRKKLPDMGIDPDPQRPLIDGFRDIYRRALVEASSLPTSVGPGSSSNILQDPPDPKSCAVPDEFFDFSTVASFDFGAGDTQTDGLRNFYPPTSVGPGSSSSIPADPARSLDFSTSFDFGSASPSSSIQADPAQFLDCSNYFDFDSGDTHNDLLSNVNPHTFLEELANSFFPPYSGAGSSSFSIKANPAQPPSSSFYTASGIVLEESAFLSSSHNSPLFDDSVSASSGAMRPLVGKLDKLLEGSVSISKRVKDGVRLLKDDVEEISSYLDELSGLEDPPPMAKCWMNEVRDLSYDIEDYIDSTLFRRPNCLNKKKKKMMMKKFTNHVKIPKIRLKCCNCKQTKSKHVKTRWVCRNIRHIVINNRRSKRPRNIGAPEMISDFRKYLQEAIERHDRYKLHCCSTLRRRFLSTGRMLPTPYEEADQIVMDDRTKTFINSLVSNDAADQQQLKVVSVLGSGCLGKTTLAKQLYNRIGMQFDCRAFIRVPKNPDMKRLFRDLFSQLHHKKQPLPTSSNELVISDNISNYLEDKRYLIVIDDLLDASVWDIIKYAFPKGNRGSRIITTTQIEDVALTCCCDNSEHVFEMKPLNDDHSRKLFFDRLFGKESGCPEEFKQVSDEIVDMCGGLPLAIINIASHLANQQNAVSMDLLIHIRDSLRSDLQSNSTSERTRQVLNLSYNNLPDCLKTCLLYLGMYPEGSIISKDDMVKKWMAERFAAREQKEQDQDMMEKAGNYFSELIDRRFIQPIYTDYNNKVLSCMVHDVVRDLIAHKSAEENFIVVVDYNRKNIALSHKVRRLSLLFGDARYAKTPANIRMSQVRSLVFFGLFECMPCIKEFKVLRVLNLQLSSHCGNHDPIDLTGISELLQLRYLKIASDVCIKLPNSMRRLQCLETLDIMGVTRLAFFPWDIIHLPHLFHLTLPADTKLLNWIGSMSDSVISLWSLGKLKYLQDLHLIDPSTHLSYYLERSMKALCSLLEGHGNLKTIVVARGSSAKNIIYGDSNVIIPWDHMAPPPLLQRFEFSPDSSIIFFRIPPWVQNLSNLRILKIAVMALQMSCLDILGSLPALTALSLHLRRAPTYEISFDNNGFSALKYFKLRFMSGLAWLNFEADAMPGLWKLKLVFNDIPEMDHQGGTPTISIEHMPGLKAISAKFGGAASDVEYALRNIISNHPSNPRVNMQFVGYSSNVDGSTKEKQSSDDIMEEPDEYVRQQIRERSSDKRISKSPESTSRLHVPEK